MSRKLRPAAAFFSCVSLAVPFLILATLASGQSAGWEPGLFYGLDGCFPLIAADSLKEGDLVTVLAADREPNDTIIESVRARSEFPECAARFGDRQNGAIARARVSQELQYDVLFAVPSKTTLRIVSGAPSVVPSPDKERLARIASASVPAAWRSKNVLIQGRRYGSAGARSVIELYLGLPQLNPSGSEVPIRTIQIRRIFMVGDAVLGGEEYDRTSGREERVDTEPPRLTFENWWESDTDRTVAFITEDDGRSWKRLSTNVGFEGIWWMAQGLRPGLPRTSEFFLYTPH